MESDQYRAPLRIICVLCKTSDETEITGPLSSKNNISAHQNCLLFSSNIYCKNSPTYDDLFGFDVEDVLKEQRRGTKLRCHYCNQRGATVGCEIKRCPRSYHYPCAVKAHGKVIEDSYAVYCESHNPERRETNDVIERNIDISFGPVESDEEEDCTTAEKHHQSTPDPKSTRPSEEVNISAAGLSNEGLTSGQIACGSEDNSWNAIDSPEHSPEVNTPKRKRFRHLEYPDDENPTSVVQMSPLDSVPEESVDVVTHPNQSTPVLVRRRRRRRSKENLNPSITGADDNDDGDDDDDEEDEDAAADDDDDTDIESESQSLLPSETHNTAVPCIIILDSGPSLESENSQESFSLISTSLERVTDPKHEETPSTSRGSPVPKAPSTDTVTPQDPASDRSVSPQHSSHNVGLIISRVPTLAGSNIKPEQLADPSPPAEMSVSPEVGTSDAETSANFQSRAAMFWMRCNQAGLTEGIFSELMSQLCSLGQKVQSEQATDQDYDVALKVLEASGQQSSIITQLEQDLERQERDLQRKKAALRDARAALGF